MDDLSRKTEVTFCIYGDFKQGGTVLCVEKHVFIGGHKKIIVDVGQMLQIFFLDGNLGIILRVGKVENIGAALINRGAKSIAATSEKKCKA